MFIAVGRLKRLGAFFIGGDNLAFDTSKLGAPIFGTGKIGDVEISDGLANNFNSYTRIIGVDELDDTKVSFDADNAIIGNYEKFEAGNEILIHVSSAPVETNYLGKYIVAKILLNQRGWLTLDRPITDLIPRDQLDYYGVQAVTFCNIDCLHLKAGGGIAPAGFDPFNLIGAILALKIYDTLYFEGGHINLEELGIPANRKQLLRPITLQETPARGEGDVAKFAGQENFLTAETFLLNAGDGAALIVAKNIVGNENSRIGDKSNFGAQFCRGAKNSIGNKPANVTNIGGSTIMICAESIKNFDSKMIAKYRDADAYEGRGLARCHIVSNTPLRNDEGLYSYDILSDSTRMKNELNIKDFGDGSFGSCTNPIKCLNNYARVIGISQGGCRLTIDNETRTGLAPIDDDALILVQIIQKGRDVESIGEVIVTKVMARYDNHLVTDFPMTEIDLKKYSAQVISIPQFSSFTLNQEYYATPKFNGKIGGVCAIAVDGTCDLSEGKINVEGKGGAPAYGYEGLKILGNAQNHNRLPLGEGHGSVFLLTKTLTLNENSRIGAKYSGLGGDPYGGANALGTNKGGGYFSMDEEGTGYGGAYQCGGAAGVESEENIYYGVKVGGIGGNGKSFAEGYTGGRQGAHLLIVADSINNFTQAAFSTGGEGGKGYLTEGGNGSAGYGGGATKYSSGGSSGTLFLYANEVQ